MISRKEDVPRMKDTSHLERELRAVLANSFDKTESINQMMRIIKEDREATLFEIGTFVISPRGSSYSSQINYVQLMRDRIKS